MAQDRIDGLTVAVCARAPVPGAAKTRLIPVLGPAGAAAFHAACIHRTLTLATTHFESVALWCAPNAEGKFFQEVRERYAIGLHTQASGDLGRKMHRIFVHHCRRTPTLLLGTDCPVLSDQLLREAAHALLAHSEAVAVPAEDGGYVLIGLRRAIAALFTDIAWGSDRVMATTRERIAMLALRYREFPSLWDVDSPDDLDRLRACGLFPPGC